MVNQNSHYIIVLNIMMLFWENYYLIALRIILCQERVNK